MQNATPLGFTDNSRLLLVTLILRVTAVVLVMLTLPIRPTLPPWMLEWFGRISWPLLLSSLLLLLFHKKAASFLQKHPRLLYTDLLISSGVIMIGGSWRSSYFGYTITTIILFTIFLGRRGAYVSSLTLIAAAVIKDPSGGLPAQEVFFVSNLDMRMGAALIYATAGAILGYFRTLIDSLEEMSRAKVEEMRKRTVIEQNTRMALELHDGAKQMIHAMVLKMNPLMKSMQSSDEEFAREFRWLWRGMNHLRCEFDQVMAMLRQDEPGPARSATLLCIVKEEARTVETMTGFSWTIASEVREGSVSLERQMPLRRFLSEAMMNAWKHSGKTAGTIMLHPADGMVVITIADEGRGFKYPPSDLSRTTGMLSLHHRTREMNGRLEFKTLPGGGCRVILTLPDQHVPHCPDLDKQEP